MALTELIPAISQLSHQDKLRLIHFLLLQVAQEEGCDLKLPDAQVLEVLSLEQSNSTETVEQSPEDLLLKQLAATEAVVWSPYEAYEAAEKLSELLTATKQEGNA